MPAGELVQLLGDVIDEVRQHQPEVTFLVATLIPVHHPATELRIRELNKAMPKMVAGKNTSGSPVHLVDQHAGFRATDHLYDGVHPNEAGEKRMAEKWFKALDPILSNRGS